jgi:hypothetical protein
MDTPFAGHRPAPVLIEPLIRHSTVGDLGNDKSISRGLKLPLPDRLLQRKIFCRIEFCSAKFFPLETFFYFSNFLAAARRFSEAFMTMGELFAVAVLLSVIFALAAHWQNNDGGGLI